MKSFEHEVRRLQHVTDWSDTLLLGILLDFLGILSPVDQQRRCIDYLKSKATPDSKIRSGP